MRVRLIITHESRVFLSSFPSAIHSRKIANFLWKFMCSIYEIENVCSSGDSSSSDDVFEAAAWKSWIDNALCSHFPVSLYDEFLMRFKSQTRAWDSIKMHNFFLLSFDDFSKWDRFSFVSLGKLLLGVASFCSSFAYITNPQRKHKTFP
jgi:hypothetical protein